MKTVLSVILSVCAAVLTAVACAAAFVVVTVVGIIAGVGNILLRAAPIIIAVLLCVWILSGCTTNVTIDNSVIDQSDVTQVLGCATDEAWYD